MMPIEMRRAIVRAKEAIYAAEKNRCADALADVTAAAMFHGKATAHAIEGDLSETRIQESSDLIGDARDAVAHCFREAPRLRLSGRSARRRSR
jgi:hypothetical protein